MNVEEKRRCEMMFSLGLRFNGDSFVQDDINVHWTEVACDSDDVFYSKVAKIKSELDRRKANADTFLVGAGSHQPASDYDTRPEQQGA